MDNKLLDSNISNSSSDVKFSNFYLLFSNMKESKKLLQSYKKFFEEYLETINGYYKQLTELNCHFLVEDKFKSSLINTPIFQMGKAIKKAVQAQINNLFSIITEENLLDSFNKSLDNLSQLLGDSSLKMNTKSYGKNIELIASSLIQSYSDIESTVIDDYISKTYNKHLIGLNKDTLENNIIKAQYLERTFLQFEEKSKNQFMEELKKMEDKTNKIFNKMKDSVNQIIAFLKNNRTEYLDILKKEVDSIWKVESNSNEDKSKQENINIEDKNNFKYKIKIIEQPFVRVEDETTETINEKNEKVKEGNNTLKKKRTLTESSIFDAHELFLTEQDIYSIISTIYSYDLQLINKSEYNLEKEKQKLKTIELTKKLLEFDLTDKDEKITKEEINELYQLTEDKGNLYKFLITLNNYRASSNFEMEEKLFDILKVILNKCQDYLVLERDTELEELLIILSQTFYIKKDGKKIYLTELIKDHKLFKMKEFWENALNEKINEELIKFEKVIKKGIMIVSPENRERKIKELIMTKLIPFTSYMKDFGGTKEMILNIINPIMDKYNFDENSRNMSLTLLE